MSLKLTSRNLKLGKKYQNKFIQSYNNFKI